jgi:hypothetical protein
MKTAVLRRRFLIPRAGSLARNRNLSYPHDERGSFNQQFSIQYRDIYILLLVRVRFILNIEHRKQISRGYLRLLNMQRCHLASFKLKKCKKNKAS